MNHQFNDYIYNKIVLFGRRRLTRRRGQSSTGSVLGVRGGRRHKLVLDALGSKIPNMTLKLTHDLSSFHMRHLAF